MPIKILLVDDNENNLLSMEVALEREDYVFLRANSGREALRILLSEADFSLILLDVMMPIMDGYETAELIYQRDKLKHIPIIFITAHDYEEAAMFKGYQAGAVDFVRKPFNPEILRSKVAVFAELYRKNQLLRKQEEKLQIINADLTRLNRELEQRVHDRTLALEKLNEELQALNISKDKFLSVMSHDLRNPLTALLASSGKLNEDPEKLTPAQVKQLSTIIHRTSNKLLNQLNEVIEWAKKQSRKTSFNPQRIKLAEGADESLELLKANAQHKKISIQNLIPATMEVMADPLMLRSIVQNLVTNAIKYTPEGGMVQLSAKTEARMVCISVTDSGIGMTAEMTARLFKNREQMSLLGTNNEQGSGLGLLLVTDFVTQHGGSITVESTPGKGTMVCFTIPGVQQTGKNAQGGRILVVDDDNDILEMITLLLAERDYDVKTLNHGAAIFDHIRNFQPELILLDVMLGDMDGRTICKELKDNPATRSVPIIMISGTHNLADVLHLPGAPDDFIAKPFDFDKLYTKIEQHLA